MDLAFWQKRARIVAYVDLARTTLSLLITVLLIVFVVAAVKYEDEIQQQLAEQGFSKESVKVLLVALCMLATIQTLDVTTKMRAAIMLFKATKPGVDPRSALYGARIWRNAPNYIVCKFISALEQANETTVHTSPDGIQIQK